jgi:hypothetical protein
MLSEKYQQIVDRLSEKTDNGELNWQETADANAFTVSFPNYSITLSCGEDDRLSSLSG